RSARCYRMRPRREQMSQTLAVSRTSQKLQPPSLPRIFPELRAPLYRSRTDRRCNTLQYTATCDIGNACDTLRRRSRKPIEKAWADRTARSDWTPLRPLARLKKLDWNRP